MEEMTARSQELSEMAVGLQRIAGNFKLYDAGEMEEPVKELAINTMKTSKKKTKAKASSSNKLPPNVSKALSKRGIAVGV